MTPNEQAADILDEAANEIDKGWCQYHNEDDDGNVCATGALNRATFGTAKFLAHDLMRYSDAARKLIYWTARHALDNTLAEQYNMVGERHGLFYYNDAHAKSGDEISTCMRKAATNLRNTL